MHDHDDEPDYTAEQDATIVCDVDAFSVEVRVPMTMRAWSQLDDATQYHLLEAELMRKLRSNVTWDSEDDRP